MSTGTATAGGDTTSRRLDLTPDQLLSTTRMVRRRLDLTRPVEPALIEECLELALQAPTGSNMQNWSFVVVTDPERRAAVAGCYRRGVEVYKNLPIAVHNLPVKGEERKALQMRILGSALYLAEHYHEVPVLVIPCVAPRVSSVTLAPSASSASAQADMVGASLYSSIFPACWSFQLAARARGLASCWTTIHLFYEEDAAAALGIPYEQVQQVGCICVGHAKGLDFKPAPREPLATKLHWESWRGG